MSVRPINFLPDGSIEVIFDELGHSGTLPAAEVVWTRGLDGSEDHNFIVLECPDGCGATSTHPVGGGAAPAQVQELFVRKVNRDGCVCPAAKAGEINTFSTAVEHVKNLVTAMDGEGRWALDDAQLQSIAT